MPDAVPTIPLPGGRRGRIIETIVAGELAIEVVANDWIARLAAAGVLAAAEVATAQLLAVLFEQSGIRPRVAGSYTGTKVDTAEVGRHALEELRAWRRLGRLLSRCPPDCRPHVEAVVLWDARPADIRRLRIGLRAIARRAA